MQLPFENLKIDENLYFKSNKVVFKLKNGMLCHSYQGEVIIIIIIINILIGTKFNKAPSNITKEESKALAELIQLQKNSRIVIKPVDKGGGIIIMSHDDYVEACEKEKIWGNFSG